MFNDNRSKRVILVSHCILNQNSISDGTADYPGTFEEVVSLLLKEHVGIIQMPCAELMCLGLDRGDKKGAERPVVNENTRIRNELLKDKNKQHIKELISGTLYQVDEYLKNGFNIQGVIGVNRSPSCGVDTTSKNNEEVLGEGVFIKALRELLESKGIELKIVGIKTSEVEESLKKVKNLLFVE
jgi:predicted secreted protein